MKYTYYGNSCCDIKFYLNTKNQLMCFVSQDPTEPGASITYKIEQIAEAVWSDIINKKYAEVKKHNIRWYLHYWPTDHADELWSEVVFDSIEPQFEGYHPLGIIGFESVKGKYEEIIQSNDQTEELRPGNLTESYQGLVDMVENCNKITEVDSMAGCYWFKNHNDEIWGITKTAYLGKRLFRFPDESTIKFDLEKTKSEQIKFSFEDIESINLINKLYEEVKIKKKKLISCN